MSIEGFRQVLFWMRLRLMHRTVSFAPSVALIRVRSAQATVTSPSRSWKHNSTMTDTAAATPSVPMQEITRGQMTGSDDGMDEETKKKRDLERTIWSRLAQGIAIASAVLAVIAIVFSSASSVTVVAGIIALGVSGAVVFQEELLQDTDTLRKVQNEIRKEVNRLQEENNVLSSEVTKVEGTVSKLKTSENRLESIAAEQGSNVSSLVSLVKENGEIQKKMIGITKAETLQRLFDAILQSDRDGDFKIGEMETRELLFRLKVDPRVEISEEVLRSRLEVAGGEISIRELTEDLMSARHDRDGDHIFSFQPEKS